VSLLEIHGSEPLDADSDVCAVLAGANVQTTGPRAYRVAADQWLLVDCELGDARRRLGRRLRNCSMRITDVSGTFSCYRFEGKSACQVLAGNPRSPGAEGLTAPGQYIRTSLGEVEVVLQYIETAVYNVYFNGSAVFDLMEWLESRCTGWSFGSRSFLQ
jgi:sarcosine oxidase gamma subunit